MRQYSAVSKGYAELFLPVAYRNQWNMTSAFAVMNVSSSSQEVWVEYRDRNGAFTWSRSLGILGANRAIGVGLAGEAGIPNGWTGWVRIWANGPLAAMGTVENTAGTAGFDAPASSGRAGHVIVLPWMARRYNGRTTGITILNPSTTASASATVIYYDEQGGQVDSDSETIGARNVLGRGAQDDPELSDNWFGSAVIRSTSPLIVVVREDRDAGAGVYAMSGYSGIVR